MERWTGRVAVVTGASSGIGAAIAVALAQKGLRVVGLARRVEKIQDLTKFLKSAKGELHALKCDVSKEAEIKEAFQWVKRRFGGVDVLVNNAAVLKNSSLIDGDNGEMKSMIDLNITGLSMCTKEALKSMKERGVDDGHIIHINSIIGHLPPMDTFCVYAATKHAVTALTEGLRKELVKQNSKIRVSSVSPGLVKTEMPPKEYLDKMAYLEPEDIADGVIYILSTPPRVQVHELMIKPVGEMF